MELLLVFPILLALLLGMIQFSMMILSRQQLLSASREGARVAATGGSEEEARDAVQRFLGNGRLGDADVQVVLTDESGQPLPSGEPVEVWVRLPTAHAVPDLLRFIGYSIRDEEIVARTVMRKE